MSKQHTLKGSFTLQGKGLHTGLPITITFNPAPENHGYKIKRVDLENQPVIDALAENVGNTQRGTVLVKDGVQISTIEHAMAALYALRIDNCLIEVNAPEFPILDGSAIQYVQAIYGVGIVEQTEERDYFVVRQKMEVVDEETGSKLTLLPDDRFCINSFIEFESKYIPNQSASLDNLEDFTKEIATARTFVFVREVQKLRDAGLIKGGDLDNAIVIYERQISQQDLDSLADLLGVPHKNASELGYLNNKQIQYPNEPARHKLLDIIGDMALIGKPIKGRIIATRPGHKINNKLARLVRKQIKLNEVQPPVYEPNKEPVFDINRIKELLPHRYPFLMVDKVIEIGQKYIVGIKNLSVNEQFFQGHFPQEPVMPGVLQIEAMAQIGGLLVLSQVDEPERYSTYFLKIDNVKFRSKAVPGDTLIFRLNMMSEIRRGIANMKGYAFIGDKLVSEAEFTAQIVKNK
ncbi:MAG: bifunctional UDP-3-O-[3-hydroxymyristoyl] N-acetylglucosamine deacetylase/3-hydroxyacyl-ACP dehydratase [Prevotella sp.]|jgi:UDP-3-O-[3-hydroxymyristoyl] N-acetylglucosamine deacetylase/3-hydroxyacyl-[acyl-carrier-protein] dehydratase|uniref:Multifunctional fusion protein n=3 Tax=Dysgonomonas gadei TaxID=156974 RepID=F5IUL9_9BACT|nr:MULTISPECIES: bifunctional UDP-3-O-[3-hydroxymyristoyl] N-acetylglucosamine deacetylase/3-hydroxyacyl-ACP dehydratase [Dysgonomonas]EGK02919.1 bifunctional enzyme lpxC/fabZ [Dysgonomonas gadei ATCC BAA-286]MBF0648562.1 bifunctional UDP-3-O-[3-hydroxymyristoyl] N-acetylglucosamine deacetylase/3-hydroxyacyl-ACP dehydratase [Dysgonomonas sp. GY75]MDR1503063.1 bifunctional UDP-3-O-[3-hydroxymyristoyl] N-acetylglucosamine deacetylase/3-hydroxyacyl-ACP dehydratase [Prevotella sp.]